MTFTKVELSHYRKLEPYFQQQKYPLSIYSLQSILVWHDLGGYEVHYLEQDGRVWFYAMHHRKPHLSHLILPVGDTRDRDPRELHEMAISHKIPAFWYVPQTYVEEFGEGMAQYFTITEQPAYEDYIYNAHDLAELAGKKYSKKRNLIAQFEKEYLVSGRVATDGIKSGDFDDCVNFLEKWCRARDCSGDLMPADADDNGVFALACEKKALVTTLGHMEALAWRGVLVRIDGEVVGLGISAPLTKDMGILCFEKAHNDIKGLYQYLDRECARRLFDGHYAYINKESDMGEPGLKHAKLSYFPVRRVKSYILTAKV